MTSYEVEPPAWLSEQDEGCEQCGHWSSFSAGFEVQGGEYVHGYYEDAISCYGGASYENWLFDLHGEEEEPDTVGRFQEFLSKEGSQEAQELEAKLKEVFNK